MRQGPTSTTIAHRRRHDILPVSLQRCHDSHMQRQRPTANTITVTGRLRASGKGFSQADDVIYRDRPRKTLEAQLSHRFRFNQHFDCAVDTWRDQDLLAICLVTETRGQGSSPCQWRHSRSVLQTQSSQVWHSPAKCPRQSPIDARAGAICPSTHGRGFASRPPCEWRVPRGRSRGSDH